MLDKSTQDILRMGGTVFDIKKYYEKENKKVRKEYGKTLIEIENICNGAKNKRVQKKKEYRNFFARTGEFILRMAKLEKELDSRYFARKSLEELKRENQVFFNELLKKNYKRSYANPTYCVEVFGNEYGQLISYFYLIFRKYIRFAFEHRIYKMYEYNKLFADTFNYIRKRKLDYKALKKIIVGPPKKDKTKDIVIDLKQKFDKEFRFLKDIVMKSNLKDLRYLFRYGEYITQNEIKTGEFLKKYPESSIKKLSKLIADAYITGFKISGKDIRKKSAVSIIYSIGQERVVHQLIKDLEKQNLAVTIMSVSSTRTNRQYSYDHRFDAALYLDKAYSKFYRVSFGKAVEKCKKIMKQCSGIIVLDKFGEKMFAPETKAEYLKFTDAQQKLFQVHQNSLVMIQDRYLPRSEISFTVISFPSPEVGRNFEKIFEDILKINMLETEKYERIQQKIIDVLDRATYVHIKGKGKSKTDIKVKMQEIKFPEKQTNFENCGADINIPVGEVFTSPQLRGTNGVLHISNTYLGGLRYKELTLKFKNGYIVDYRCRNFQSAKENKKYIEENLLFPHKTLPIGEFAIGTNTLAYVIAKKHKIMNILPVLIVEKMGPHFAVGDTCYAMSEDKPVFNKLDNKEIVARENEKTAVRKTNVNKAYTFKHQDITIPYESIKFIKAVSKDGKETNIIKDGRFVLPGTKILNRPLKAANSKRDKLRM